MLKLLFSNKFNLSWVFFHAILGFISTFTPFVLIIWFYSVLFLNFRKAISNLNAGKPFLYIALLAYLTSFEMLVRMAKAYPYIPTELSKYLIITFSLFGMFKINRVNEFWLVLVVITLFHLIIDVSGKRVFSDIINNYFGFLAICLFLAFLLKFKFLNFEIEIILKLILFSIIPSLIFTYIKTPDFNDIQFSLKANFETSGGAATNQVATVFGFASLLCLYFWLNRLNLSGNRSLDIILGIAFFTQGLLTFSRGGIIVAIMAMVVYFLINSGIFKFSKIFLGVIVGVLLISVFNFVDKRTGGNLLLRYQGETEGTYRYGAEKNLQKITSGRTQIFIEDLELWYSHIFLGVGTGSSLYLRGGGDVKVSSHIELSRLLAEQGIIGLIYFIALLNIGIKLWRISRIDPARSIYFILFFVGLMTTFHAAMRTFVTPLLIGLSTIGIHSVKSKNEKSVSRSN